ncbi:hypothetical protein A2U01_0013822, partial [Trifolium medium]|nr:hypothetical protein [Trifolium medium]
MSTVSTTTNTNGTSDSLTAFGLLIPTSTGISFVEISPPLSLL